MKNKVEITKLKRPLIIVEGKKDVSALEKVLDKDVKYYITGGDALDLVKLKEIKKLEEKYDLIIFSDPDFPGHKIRQTIEREVSAYNAHIKRLQGISDNKKKIGVEHARKEDLMYALSNLNPPKEIIEKKENNNNFKNYSTSDLIEYGLYNDKKKREYLCEELGVGYSNNKQLIKKLNTYEIEREEVVKIIENYNKR